jgi:hypothetical protein
MHLENKGSNWEVKKQQTDRITRRKEGRKEGIKEGRPKIYEAGINHAFSTSDAFRPKIAYFCRLLLPMPPRKIISHMGKVFFSLSLSLFHLAGLTDYRSTTLQQAVPDKISC